MKAKVSVGIIGLGRMGQIYAEHLAGLQQVRIASVSDLV
jgi:3-hydroxyisobutyrate dehydrogenase-like beta-hydroxyacid dehydrogenase